MTSGDHGLGMRGPETSRKAADGDRIEMVAKLASLAGFDERLRGPPAKSWDRLGPIPRHRLRPSSRPSGDAGEDLVHLAQARLRLGGAQALSLIERFRREPDRLGQLLLGQTVVIDEIDGRSPPA